MAAPQKGTSEPVFVYCGTPAWDAWMEHKRRLTGRNFSNLTTTVVVDGKTKRGWNFPSLFPPQASGATGPPDEDPLPKSA